MIVKLFFIKDVKNEKILEKKENAEKIENVETNSSQKEIKNN